MRVEQAPFFPRDLGLLPIYELTDQLGSIVCVRDYGFLEVEEVLVAQAPLGVVEDVVHESFMDRAEPRMTIRPLAASPHPATSYALDSTW